LEATLEMFLTALVEMLAPQWLSSKQLLPSGTGLKVSLETLGKVTKKMLHATAVMKSSFCTLAWSRQIRHSWRAAGPNARRGG